MTNYCTNFQKNHSKTEGGVCNTKLLNLKYVYNQSVQSAGMAFVKGANERI